MDKWEWDEWEWEREREREREWERDENKGRRQDTRDPDYFEGNEWDDEDEEREIEARLAAYENWLGRT